MLGLLVGLLVGEVIVGFDDGVVVGELDCAARLQFDTVHFDMRASISICVRWESHIATWETWQSDVCGEKPLIPI